MACKRVMIVGDFEDLLQRTGVPYDDKVVNEIIEKYLQRKWYGKERKYIIAAMFTEYLQRISMNKYFLREIGEMIGVDWRRLSNKLKSMGVRYIIDYDLRAREMLGEAYKYWKELYGNVGRSPPVLMATIEWLIRRAKKVDLAAKYGITEVSIRNCYRQIKMERPDILKRIE